LFQQALPFQLQLGFSVEFGTHFNFGPHLCFELIHLAAPLLRSAQGLLLSQYPGLLALGHLF
jgi:hypothetical protein